MDNLKEVTSEQYAKIYLPKPGYVLIQRDMPPKKHGRIILPANVKENIEKASSTGVIVAKSPIPPESQYDCMLWDLYLVGDRVGFDMTVPFMAPLPAFMRFANPENEVDNSVTLHIADLMGWIADSETDSKKLLGRIVKDLNKEGA